MWYGISLWFWFAFPWWLMVLSIFSHASSKKYLCKSFAYFKIGLFAFLLLSCKSSFFLLFFETPVKSPLLGKLFPHCPIFFNWAYLVRIPLYLEPCHLKGQEHWHSPLLNQVPPAIIQVLCFHPCLSTNGFPVITGTHLLLHWIYRIRKEPNSRCFYYHHRITKKPC